MSGAFRSIKDTLAYFDYFSYPLTLKEIHTFYPEKITVKKMKEELVTAVKTGTLEYDPVSSQYALRGHGINFNKRVLRQEITNSKLSRLRIYLALLYTLPYIELIGLSGSCAMANAQKKDDVDLFIISAPGRMWLSRFTAILLAKLLGIHRSRGMTAVQDKVCLNLFFDHRELAVPNVKRNMYVAHEIVQMRPLHIRGRVYSCFIQANEWVYDYFPQTISLSKNEASDYVFQPSLIGNLLEACVRTLQLKLMSPRTREIISETQLWFFPKDFELKLRRKKII